jgi:hypothetical protein
LLLWRNVSIDLIYNYPTYNYIRLNNSIITSIKVKKDIVSNLPQTNTIFQKYDIAFFGSFYKANDNKHYDVDIDNIKYIKIITSN